ncbi:ABC transporter ATP-binding protein [Rhizobium lemnae]|uniref:ABC transporter ATP-binding protein n=1 Tax=Rhizobium lemnae TaxID=1214924 RepID=A0ABV8EEY5_9HYPH|nr:ABC transporter ATP-binding protein [Rhizobium lemnae]MCJ8508670.1 ABC transporter ATP-binding protein [Rhizobium lemnae]
MSVLSVENVGFKRGGIDILTDLSFEILEGERLGIVGPSGAGKTTLLRLLSLLESPTHGVISVRARQTYRRPKVQIGLLFQDLGLFPHMKVMENAMFPLLARGISRIERRKQAQAALEAAGLGHLGERFPAELSGGERQRVAIVRTLLSEPDVILLDEPFAALDPHLVHQFAEWLDGLIAGSGVSVVVVTHDVRFALGWVDRLLFVADGKILQQGRPVELYTTPRNTLIAGFMDRTNVLRGQVRSVQPGGIHYTVADLSPGFATAEPELLDAMDCYIIVRPHHLTLTERERDGLPGWVIGMQDNGSHTTVIVETEAELRLKVSHTGPIQFSVGTAIGVAWPPQRAHAVAI